MLKKNSIELWGHKIKLKEITEVTARHTKVFGDQIIIIRKDGMLPPIAQSYSTADESKYYAASDEYLADRAKLIQIIAKHKLKIVVYFESAFDKNGPYARGDIPEMPEKIIYVHGWKKKKYPYDVTKLLYARYSQDQTKDGDSIQYSKTCYGVTRENFVNSVLEVNPLNCPPEAIPVYPAESGDTYITKKHMKKSAKAAKDSGYPYYAYRYAQDIAKFPREHKKMLKLIAVYAPRAELRVNYDIGIISSWQRRGVLERNT